MKKLGTSKVKEESGNNASTIHTVGTASNGKMACYCCNTAGLLSAGTKPLSAMDVANWGTSRECVGADKKAQPPRILEKSTRAVNKVDESGPEEEENELP